MKTPSLASTLLSTFAVILITFSAALAQPGGYRPTDTNDAGVELAADFAVKEQASRAKSAITLNKIIKASDKEPKLGARDFMLCLDTNVKDKRTVVQAIVTMDQYSNLKLMGWSKSTCGNSTGKGAAAGAFKPLEANHAGAGLAADFAVMERSKTLKTPVKLVNIIKAEMDESKMLGAGTFRLCISASGSGIEPSSQVLVSMDQYNNLKLLSWKASKCGETDGEYKLVESGFTAGVDLAADWAVGQHSKDTGIAHKLVEILKREEMGMFAVTYRICMKVSEEGKTQTIQAVVSRDQYSNHKLVSWEHSNCTK